MKQHRIQLQSQVKLVFVTAFLSLIGLVFVSNLQNNSAYSDDAFRTQLEIFESIDSDFEQPNTQDTSPDALFSNSFIFTTIFFAGIIGTFNHINNSFTFKYLTRPRAPPLF